MVNYRPSPYQILCIKNAIMFDMVLWKQRYSNKQMIKVSSFGKHLLFDVLQDELRKEKGKGLVRGGYGFRADDGLSIGSGLEVHE